MRESMPMISHPALTAAPRTRVVHIVTDRGSLTAELTEPRDATGVIVFAGTNAAQRSARYDRRLAESLHEAGFATLLLDLLTPSEELVDGSTCSMRSDIALLSRRLIETIDWLGDQRSTARLDVGIMGEDAGAAAAMVAACFRPYRVASIVANADQLDLAESVLPRVRAAALLIVSGNDMEKLKANEIAFKKLSCRKGLVCVPLASSALDREVTRLATDWFTRTVPALAAVSSRPEEWARP